MSTRTLGRVAQGAHRARTALGAVLVLVALMVAGYADAPSASAYPVLSAAAADTGTAAVIGTVTINVTPKGSPDGIVVTLTEIPTSGNSQSRTAKADSRGGFRFDGVAGGPDWTYSVAATYLGTTFESDSVQVESGKIVDVPLRLFASTTSAAAVSQPTWDVWVDLTATGLAVQQDVGLANKGTAAYTGSTVVPDSPAGLDHAAFTLPITDKADNLEFLGRFQACCSYVKGATWTHTRPISPGTSTGTLRYETPSVDRLTFPVTLPTAAFRLFVPQSLTITSSQLSKDGTSSDRGVTYDVYAAAGALKAGDVVTVAVAGAPAQASSPAWWLVAVAALVLVVALVAIAVAVRRRRSATGNEAATAATTTKGAAVPQPAKSRPTPAASSKAQATKAAATKAGQKKQAAPTRDRAPTSADPTASESRVATTAPAPPQAAAPEPAAPQAKAKATTATRGAARSRADELTDELATLDLARENGTITDERAYQRIRESLLAQLVAEVGGGTDG
jgi:hypothetical protein